MHTFSRIAPTYEEKYGTKLSQAHDECLRMLSRWLCTESPERVLDIGCGTGALIERMFAQWPDARFEGVDPAQGMVDEGAKRRPFASFVKGVAEALPFPSQSMDLVVCSMSFGHWADKFAGLNEVRRVLKAQGLFCLVENKPAGACTLQTWLSGTACRLFGPCVPWPRERPSCADLCESDFQFKVPGARVTSFTYS